MAKKRTAKSKSTSKAKVKSSVPRSFGGVIRERSRHVKEIARALRDIVFDELPDAQESFYGGTRPMAMYRTIADVCWIQPLNERCNIYFMRGHDLTDVNGVLEGKSDRHQFAKITSLEDVEGQPIRQWLKETVALNQAIANAGMGVDEVLQKMRAICLRLPQTKETMTWGKPHFRVGEKIFCGCGEDAGRPRLGLKANPVDAKMLMRLPGIEKAPYSRPNDGWIAVDPNVFEDWEEIERLVRDSYRLIAPKRIAAELD